MASSFLKKSICVPFRVETMTGVRDGDEFLKTWLDISRPLGFDPFDSFLCVHFSDLLCDMFRGDIKIFKIGFLL